MPVSAPRRGVSRVSKLSEYFPFHGALASLIVNHTNLMNDLRRSRRKLWGDGQYAIHSSTLLFDANAGFHSESGIGRFD
jgi:hypothetical protein